MKNVLSIFLLVFAVSLTSPAVGQPRGLPDFAELVERHGAALVNITTTQVYTKLDFQHLAKVYDAAHPRAKPRGQTESDE